MKDFVHLHLHTEYSLLDGACRIDRVIDAAKALGQKAIAVTDHGVMYGVVDFYKKAKEAGIKPIIGCEVYVAPRSRHDRVRGLDNEHGHLILLCKNEQGYQNLIKLVSRGFLEGFYGKPRIDHELLTQYHEGLIALSACLFGEVARALTGDDYDRAKQTAEWYRGLFGEDYYLEIQNHGLPEQRRIQPLLLRLSRETGIPLVATNDVHYVNREDARMQEVLICIQTGKTLEDADRLEFSTDEMYLKSGDEMTELFPSAPEACENTIKIAEKCDYNFEFGKTKLPHYDCPGDHLEYLKSLAEKGLAERYGEPVDPAVRERMDYELRVIAQMGYVDYYLIVWDFIHYAKTKGIPVGPGRGSGAGSLVAYCIGITDLDPIRYQLIFERFLNPERVSMPDFDVDFCYVRREEVVAHLIEQYGADHVSQIVTFGTLAAKAAIRDVGRVMNLPYAAVDTVAKLVPFELNITLEKALEESPELKAKYQEDEQIRELIDMARKIEGMPRHASRHAAGVVITEQPVDHYVPLAQNDEAVVTQFPMTTLEELGLLKIDLLGLRNLTVISDACKLIRAGNPGFSIEKISTEDAAVFDLFSKGQTEGVFQFESAGMKSVLMQLKPESLEDLIAVISLYRPGPMKSIPVYLENRHHPDQITYAAPQLERILRVTYGCLVYQEQVMQVFRELGGYSYGRADIVRRAMSKKKHDVMRREKAQFIAGAQKNGVSAEVADRIFEEMSSFSSYAFNKSHAACYALVAYRTAWLKCHYPAEYFAALLTSVLSDSGKIGRYIAECIRLGIRILPPDVNQSRLEFSVSEQGIVFGLLAIKNLGAGLIDGILSERDKNGPFLNFYDFCRRMQGKDLNRRALESLIKSGSLDHLDLNRREMLLSQNQLLQALANEAAGNVEGQLGLFGTAENSNAFKPERCDDFPQAQLLSMEKETTGIYLSGHPLAEYGKIADALHADEIAQIKNAENGEYADGVSVTMLGIVDSVRIKSTKNGSSMAYVVFEDQTDSVEVIVFPKTLSQYASFLQEGVICVIRGRISQREDRDVQVICETVAEAVLPKAGDSLSAPQPHKVVNEALHSRYAGLHLRLPSRECSEFRKIEAILKIFDGNVPVYFKFSDTGSTVLAPRTLFTELNEPMLAEIRHIIGRDNVYILE